MSGWCGVDTFQSNVFSKLNHSGCLKPSLLNKNLSHSSKSLWPTWVYDGIWRAQRNSTQHNNRKAKRQTWDTQRIAPHKNLSNPKSKKIATNWARSITFYCQYFMRCHWYESCSPNDAYQDQPNKLTVNQLWDFWGSWLLLLEGGSINWHRDSLPILAEYQGIILFALGWNFFNYVIWCCGTMLSRHQNDGTLISMISYFPWRKWIGPKFGRMQNCNPYAITWGGPRTCSCHQKFAAAFLLPCRQEFPRWVTWLGGFPTWITNRISQGAPCLGMSTGIWQPIHF